MYPKIIKELIEDFQKLPGIGEKTAERLALYLINNFSMEDAKNFADHIINSKDKLSNCQVCGLITDINPCKICENKLRNEKLLMIVSESRDVYLLERTGVFKGKYHVLGGLIDFSRGINERDLNIQTLIPRLNGVTEVVIATNSTVEGELTAQYLKHLMQDYDIKVTRLAYGIPAGSDLKYADSQTLSQAIINRRDF
ncbi:MAG TPA: recombination mediator RecR [Acholeplasmataceae bacterium]|nr:recombination mediator RecR [Acholeplasmataceae bacterium]HQC30657.1 recombination mediator RecR [Acholeplasmataceae bacterium]